MECPCGKESDYNHTCPFKTDIDDDYTECNCCDDCTNDCSDDI